ncbi:hypothetical protein [uncultured Porphyromonas sp.]|uniref:hypothetical protein n=1 Tax=uncultured Porphyromonas sp. TaxID=159274 RepID=UPI002639D78B|nr:hypothetical protein [uncultured Porphyromonas sp.]
MKVKNILVATMALIGLTLFASSCKEDDENIPENASPLANTEWEAKVKDNKTDIDPIAWVLTFDANNRFTITSMAGNLGAKSRTGTYIYKHPKATLSLDKAWDAQPGVLSFDLTRTSENTLTGYFFTKKLKVDFIKKK